MLTRQVVKRPADEEPCEACGAEIRLGAPVWLRLDLGTAYCCRICAELDNGEEGYGGHGGPLKSNGEFPIADIDLDSEAA